MFRIAHLSDVHTLEPEADDGYSWGVKFVSIQRPLDAKARLLRFQRALGLAKKSAADHVVISGDLTELGSPAQFSAFARVLEDSGILPEKVTLVPGNHDAYFSGDAWSRALAGPLRAYAPTSASAPGQVVDRGPVVILPVDTTRYQNVALSGGEIGESAMSALGKRIGDTGFRQKAVVLVTHHPPFLHPRRVWQYIDGLRGAGRLAELLSRHAHVQVLHGHMHRALDRLIGGLGRSRVFGAPAIVEDDDERPRVRLYEVRSDGLESVGIIST